MNGGRAWWIGGLAAWLLVTSPLAGETDDRSREIVRRDCSTGLGRNEVTLFANGTIRLREWTGEESEMRLAELGRDEIEAYVRRLNEVDLRESGGGPPAGVSGEWVERCELTLASGEGEPRRFRYGRFDTHDLALASLLRIVDELAATAAERVIGSTLPGDYLPRLGDVLARPDGVEFEVVGFTVTGDGVELRGVLDPLTIYVASSDLSKLFARLVRRRS